jgi:hypothetical protein
MLLTVLLSLFKLLFKLSHFLSCINHLTGISATRLFPGLLCGVEGLNRLVLCRAVLLEPTTLDGIVGGIGPIYHLAPLAILGRTALFWGSSIGPSPMRALLGHTLSHLGGCCSLSIVGSGFLIVLLNKELLDILKVLEHCAR